MHSALTSKKDWYDTNGTYRSGENNVQRDVLNGNSRRMMRDRTWLGVTLKYGRRIDGLRVCMRVLTYDLPALRAFWPRVSMGIKKMENKRDDLIDEEGLVWIDEEGLV
ncbi:hypothetical protein THOM_1241 [Trachipleistophora hominis]|uniref:Uncharacterized protein n=1 Tax=Trachipleistophora hominis TaxID=72359 RepID=L7JWV3_TRAHO|nr:hypothetical protein THOM_1241 [Trachipleistophora hominis]